LNDFDCSPHRATALKGKEGETMRKWIMVIFLILTLTATVFSQTYTSFPIGEYWQFPDARTLGLAGAGSISNPTGAGLFLNPAALSKNRSKMVLQLSGAVTKLEERRSYPIYNRIDDVIQQGIYVVNNNWHPYLQGDLLMGLNIGAFPYLKTIAVGIHNDVNQDYKYEEEVRENIFGDTLLAYNEIAHKGKLNRYAFGAGFEATKEIQLGFQVGVLQGDLQNDSSITYVVKGYTDVSFSRLRKLDNTPIVETFGAIYDINERVSLGSHIQLPYSVDYKFTDDATQLSGTESIEYPMTVTGALEYRAQQVLQARLNIDFTYEWWSQTKYKYAYQNNNVTRENLEDAIAVKVGIEHIFHDKIPFQVGLQYRTSYLDRSQSRTLITAGTGFMGSNWQVDAAGGFSNLDYKYHDLFDDALYNGNRSFSPTDDVDETFFFGMVTLRVYLQK
jgi:hypothetical protein